MHQDDERSGVAIGRPVDSSRQPVAAGQRQQKPLAAG
jgi:hypothetical protein